MLRGVAVVVLAMLAAVALPAPALALSCGAPPTWSDVVDDQGGLAPDTDGALVVAAYVHEVVASAVPLPPLTSRRNATRLVGVWGDREAEPYVLLPPATRGGWIDLLPESCNRSPRRGELLVTLVHDRHPLGVEDAFVTREIGAGSPDSPSGVSYGIPAERYDHIAAVLERALGPGDTAPPSSPSDTAVAHVTVWWPHAALALLALAAVTRLGRRRRAVSSTAADPPASAV